MNTIIRRIAFAVSVVAVAAAATPSFAQTRAQRMVQPQYQESFDGQAQNWGQLSTPGLRNPYECWSDEGNGRFTNCNNAGS